MIKICNEQDNCTACGACVNVCPKDAIFFEINQYGFEYPQVDSSKCIDCKMCEKTCDLISRTQLTEPLTALAATNKEHNILMKSSSGGVFSVLAEYVLEKNGAICGCVYDDKLKPIHICSEKKTDYVKMRKSKYVQSNVGYIYREVKDRLKTGQIVLFTGTPCQVAALKVFLGKDFENLITMDLVCHGVPSEAMFKEFLAYLERKYRTEIVKFDFRSKKYGWQRFTMEFTDKKGKVRNIGKMNEFYFPAFTGGNMMRPSCFSCKYATRERVGDITVGDFWGHERVNLSCDKKNGISICTLNSRKSVNLFEILKEHFLLEEIDYSIAVNGNTCLRHPTPKGNKWDDYMQAYKDGKIEEVAKEYRTRNKKARCRGKLKLLLPLNVFLWIKALRKK